MGLKYFNIIFDNEFGVYYAGQQVQGTVRFGLNAPKKIKSIRLRMDGKAEVRWEEHRHSHHRSGTRRNTTTHTEVYRNVQKYFKYEILLLGNEVDEQILPIGDHTYPFSYLLPTDIPSSFEGKHGHIRYTVRASLIRPWKYNHDVRAIYSVICPLDINADLSLQDSVENGLQKTFGMFCCASGPLSVNMSLPAGGAVPGETLLPTIRVDNSSKVHINFKLQFIQVLEFHARGKTKVETLKITKKNLGELSTFSSKIWNNETFPIPPLPPSNLLHCRIIDIKYFVRLKCVPLGAHLNLNVYLPLVLGTIPLRQQFVGFSSSNTVPPLGWNHVPTAPLATDVPPGYVNLLLSSPAPPSYEQAISQGASNIEEEGDDQHVFGEKTYTPRYPVYHAASHQPQPAAASSNDC